MENLKIIENGKNIEVVKPKLNFSTYTKIKESATLLAEQLKDIEVTEETIKTNKKLVAEVKKRINLLEAERIEAKKTILEPYKEIEEEVKEITEIVSDAENLIRKQIRAFEEKEREEKEKQIKDLFEKRKKQYEHDALYDFSDFIKPNYLNKSTSIKAIEDEIIKYFEKIDTDFEIINKIAIANTYKLEEIVVEYKSTKEPLSAVNNYENRKRVIETVKEEDPGQEISVEYIYKLFSKKDADFLELLMEKNNIKYKRGF